MESNASPDYRAVTDRLQAAWSTGDFNQLARQVVSVSEALVQAVDPRPGQRVLDVACGSGNSALVAARRYCEVTGLDFAPPLLEHARARAAAEGSKIDFRVGDAQALPFADASFDVVLSTFGVMFAPDQEKAAGELLRVCRPGGKIGLAAWSPEGMFGDLFEITAKYAPPPPGLKPPVRWGTEEGVVQLLGAGAKLQLESRRSLQYFLSVDHVFETMRKYLGPTIKLMETLDAAGQAALRADLLDHYRRFNRATDGTVVFDPQYLQAVATRK